MLISGNWRYDMTHHIKLLGLLLLLIPTGTISTAYAETTDRNALTSDQDQEQQTQIYQPAYRSPQQLIDSIKPLYGEQLRLSTDGKVVLFNAPQPVVSEIQELLPTLDHPPRQLQVELSSTDQHEQTSKSYGTSKRYLPQQFVITEGEPLTLLQQRQGQTVSGSLWWHEVNSIPTQQAYLQITATVIGQQVAIDLTQQTLNNDRLARYDNRITGKLDEWISLSGRSSQDKTYATGNRSPVTQAIKISLHNE